LSISSPRWCACGKLSRHLLASHSPHAQQVYEEFLSASILASAMLEYQRAQEKDAGREQMPLSQTGKHNRPAGGRFGALLMICPQTGRRRGKRRCKGFRVQTRARMTACRRNRAEAVLLLTQTGASLLVCNYQRGTPARSLRLSRSLSA
jgi:hypothetical protein